MRESSNRKTPNLLPLPLARLSPERG